VTFATSHLAQCLERERMVEVVNTLEASRSLVEKAGGRCEVPRSKFDFAQ
jgi:hypothetical protein